MKEVLSADALALPELAVETLLPAVAAAYALTPPVTSDWRSAGLNDVFRIRAGGEICFLKVYRAGWRDREEVLAEIAAIHHLKGKGMRVAAPIARRDGALVWAVALPEGKRQVALYACAAGTQIDVPNEATWRLYGRTLADLHRATDDFTAAPLRYDIESLLIAPLLLLDAFLEDRPADRVYLRDVGAALRARLDSLPLAALDRGYCHGDYRAANVTLDAAADAVTIFDLELGGTGFRAYDLAYTYTTLHPIALEWLWRAPAPANHAQQWAAFLAGYAESRPLGPAERAAIPLFAALRPIQIMADVVKAAGASDGRETWPPRGENGLPGGDLFDRMLKFLHAWDELLTEQSLIRC